ncbi:hypothetical protein P4H32_29370 [Bacillus cereus]|nr:hypothetical protein [Bacillus cereus]
MKKQKMTLFLINPDKQTWRYIRDVQPDALSKGEGAALKELCPKYANELQQGDWLILAERNGTQYRASYRASYEEWLLKERPQAPYYIDVAEMDERLMFVEILQDGTQI